MLFLFHIVRVTAIKRKAEPLSTFNPIFFGLNFYASAPGL